MAMGGKRPGAGRKPGTPNRITADVKALAQKYAPEAMAELGRLCQKAKSEQARVAAIKEILERAYGKSTQPISGDSSADAIKFEMVLSASEDAKRKLAQVIAAVSTDSVG